MDGTGSDFFVSYNSADERWAEWISHMLEDAGYSVVVQAWDFRPGSNFVLEMQQALRTSERVIAVLSPDYLAARYPQAEWAAVFAADPEGASRKLVPVMVRPCQPEGLLAQIVQIRIHDLDDAPAKQRLLDGVRAGRSKPATPPAFPGAAGSGSGRAAGGSAATGRLRWQRLPSTPTVIWRCELEDRIPNQSGSEAVELHLVPVGDDARLQVLELTELKQTLPEHGRRHDIFSPTEALDTRNDGRKTVVFSRERGKVAGIAVTREGQRSAWVGLPRDMLGAVLDQVHLTDQLVEILGALTSLSLPAAELAVPVTAIEPATTVAAGSVAQMPRSSAQIGHGMPQHVRPAADDALAWTAVRDHGKDVAAELAARLVAEHRTAARLW